mmetsp:Transcript_3269/g.4050  ORF Transcript_3269/g.4050 Transcript_3269/m.4050 type:complete len:245 (-) Transcript_3269:46-780(-)
MTSNIIVTNDKDMRASFALTEIEFEQMRLMDVKGTSTWLQKHGFRDFVEIFKEHQINGEILSMLDENHLKEIGVNVIGRRLKFLKVLGAVKSASRNYRRNKVIWQAAETRSVTICGAMYYASCCFLQPPESYKLTGMTLKLRTTEYNYPCLPCMGYKSVNHNVFLAEIIDVDSELTKNAPGCSMCFGEPDRIQVEVQEGDSLEPKYHMLTLPLGQGEKTAQLIRNHAEDAKEMQAGGAITTKGN